MCGAMSAQMDARRKGVLMVKFHCKCLPAEQDEPLAEQRSTVRMH